MKKMIKHAAIALFLISSMNGCQRVEPNYEGVKMENWGRNGKADFHVVTGNQGILMYGQELFQVPMFETSGGFSETPITAKDGGTFKIDPAYTYKPIRGRGIDIVFNFKHLGLSDGNTAMDNVEEAILNRIVFDSFREISRTFSTDELMNNLNKYERAAEEKVRNHFRLKGFELLTLTSGLEPPQSMKTAIEARNNAIQEAEKVRNQLETSKMLLEKAKIDAEANRISSAGLTNEILTEKWIDAIKTTKNKVIITDGKTPIILN